MKWWEVVIVLIALIIVVFMYDHYSRYYTNNDAYLQEMLKLESKIDSIKSHRDSLHLVIDSTHTEMINIKHTYEKTVDIIHNNSVDSNYVFFTNYINNYSRLRSDIK